MSASLVREKESSSDSERGALYERLFSKLDARYPPPFDNSILPDLEPLPSWEDWLQIYFPHVCTHPFAERHKRLWEWFESLEPGERPRPRVEVWPRGGAKSSTAELAIARLASTLKRHFALYVSETQDQANLHVSAVATHLETLGIQRALNAYGNSRGWRLNMLRTADGFNVLAFGLDAAGRGVKLDQYRPDLMLFDDIDNHDDSLKTVDKKINTITSALIPAGSRDCAILFLQNLIYEDSILSMLSDDRADFLLSREVAQEPAVIGLQTEIVTREDGARAYAITGGVATWEGQSLAICEEQITEWGLKAFLREAQHEVKGAGGFVFNPDMMPVVEPGDVPPLLSLCLAWDLAATEGGGNWTVGFLLGKANNGTYYVLAVLRGQWSSERVRGCIALAQRHYRLLYDSALRLHIPQDGGQAGKDQAQQFRTALQDDAPRIEPVTGKKATRATGAAKETNLGNVYLVNQPLPAFLAEAHSATGNRALMEDLSTVRWHRDLKWELRRFREDETDQQDDQVDGFSDAFNELSGYRPMKQAFRKSRGGYA